MQPNNNINVPAAFIGGIRPIRLRPPPPKTLLNPDDELQSKFSATGPLNRPPIDPVMEDED